MSTAHAPAHVSGWVLDHEDLLFRRSLVPSFGGSLSDSVAQKLSVNFHQQRLPRRFQLRWTGLTAGVLNVHNRAPVPTPFPTSSSNATFSDQTRPYVSLGMACFPAAFLFPRPWHDEFSSLAVSLIFPLRSWLSRSACAPPRSFPAEWKRSRPSAR